MVAYTCYPNPWETEAGGSRVQGQPRSLETSSNEEERKGVKHSCEDEEVVLLLPGS